MGFKGSHHKPPPGLKLRGGVQRNCCAKPVSCNRKDVVHFKISNAAHLRLIISFCCFLTFQLRGRRDLTLDCSHAIFTAICLELQELLPGDGAPAAAQAHDALRNTRTQTHNPHHGDGEGDQRSEAEHWLQATSRCLGN